MPALAPPSGRPIEYPDICLALLPACLSALHRTPRWPGAVSRPAHTVQLLLLIQWVTLLVVLSITPTAWTVDETRTAHPRRDLVCELEQRSCRARTPNASSSRVGSSEWSMGRWPAGGSCFHRRNSWSCRGWCAADTLRLKAASATSNASICELKEGLPHLEQAGFCISRILSGPTGPQFLRRNRQKLFKLAPSG